MQESGKFNLKTMEKLPLKTQALVFDNIRVAGLVKAETDNTLSPEGRIELDGYKLEAREYYRQELLAKAGLTPDDSAEIEDLEKRIRNSAQSKEVQQ
jgi:hypothetical protein